MGNRGGIEGLVVDTAGRYLNKTYAQRIALHEAGHFLIAYLVGLLPKVYTLSTLDAVQRYIRMEEIAYLGDSCKSKQKSNMLGCSMVVAAAQGCSSQCSCISVLSTCRQCAHAASKTTNVHVIICAPAGPPLVDQIRFVLLQVW